MLGDGRQLCVIGEFVVVENGQTVAQGLVDGETVAFGQRRGDEPRRVLVEGVELGFAGISDYGHGSFALRQPLCGVWVARVNVPGDDQPHCGRQALLLPELSPGIAQCDQIFVGLIRTHTQHVRRVDVGWCGNRWQRHWSTVGDDGKLRHGECPCELLGGVCRHRGNRIGPPNAPPHEIRNQPTFAEWHMIGMEWNGVVNGDYEAGREWHPRHPEMRAVVPIGADLRHNPPNGE